VLAVDLMTRGVATVRPEDTLATAVRRMQEHHCGSVVIVDPQDFPLGILTDRDVCMAALHTDKPLLYLQVEAHMHTPVHTVRERDTLTHVEGVMGLHRVRRVPVVDSWSRLVGILSIDDLAREARRTKDIFARATSPAAVGRTLVEICRPSLVDNAQELATVGRGPFDLVLQDIMKSGVNGHGSPPRMTVSERQGHVPAPRNRASGEIPPVVRRIEPLAAEPERKSFKPRPQRDQEQKSYLALVESQKHLAAELKQAAEYVTSLLPPRLTKGPVTSDWRLLPSQSLGGDAFGHHWIDPDHLAVYLLDVCGHGVSAALLSITVMNVIRSQSLPGTDFRRPAQVLRGLNEAFPMEAQNDMYFTIWYGVFHRCTGQVTFGSAGHNPAVLVDAKGVVNLSTNGPIIGFLPGVEFPEASHAVAAGSRLYLFSDGAYELRKACGERMGFDEFSAYLGSPSGRGADLDGVIQWARDVQQGSPFDDDFSILWLQFS
jgi:sigma-B regulation protein RsbU (phosphoserine phosphatase)